MAVACELAPEVEDTTSVVEPTEMEAEGSHGLGGDSFVSSDASMEAEVKRLRGALAAANAKMHAMSDEYMTVTSGVVGVRKRGEGQASRGAARALQGE